MSESEWVTETRERRNTSASEKRELDVSQVVQPLQHGPRPQMLVFDVGRVVQADLSEDLAELLMNHPNSSHILLMGDCNARLDPNIDPTQQHVGPHVVGKRQTILDIERDNALHLIDLFERHGMELPQEPQTFQDLPLQRRVSKKEMNCQDHLLETADITDWTTLLCDLTPFASSIYNVSR